MGLATFLSHKVESTELEKGDHIYSWRLGFTYAHHGIYVGEDRVVHFTHQLISGVNSSSHHTCKSNSSSTSFPDCGFKKSVNGVTVSCLNCFMKHGSLYRYKYGVRKRVCVGKIRGGTCTIAKSDDPEAVIHRAMYLLDNGFGEYNLLKKNCEDFALYCKTGLLVPPEKNSLLGGSGQVCFASGGFGPVARYYSDIGVRKDAVKVELKDVAAFLGNKRDD